MDTNNNNNKSNYVLSASILIAAVLIGGSVIYSKGLGVSGQGEANIGSVIAGNPFEIQENDIVLGEENAPVTVFIYSDPSCPFCAAAAGGNEEVMDYLKQGMPDWTPPIPNIIDNYVGSGDVKLIYRYFPGHGSGNEAMEVLYCSNEQGKFWELDKILANNQESLTDINKIKELAVNMGIDIDKIDNCLEFGEYDSKMIYDAEMGKKAGVNGTPAFFVNETLIEGAYPFSEFKTLIDSMLK
ncbi:DsbA family protein [Patescibacteria group bacterium]|nr:DsbA family protein [Patescibacteria group bacterium]